MKEDERKPAKTYRAGTSVFATALALALGAEALLVGIFSIPALTIGLGVFGVLAAIGFVFAALMLARRIKDHPKLGVLYLIGGGAVVAYAGSFLYWLAQCGSIVNCGTGRPAYHVLAIVAALTAINIAGAIMLWFRPVERSGAPGPDNTADISVPR